MIKSNLVKIDNSGIGLIKLRDYKETFIKYLDVDKKTLNTYKVGIYAFENYLRKNNINNPTRDDIIDFRDYLRENKSTNTTNTYMIAIRSMFKYLDMKGIYPNIAIDIKGARYDNTPKKEVLSIEKVKEIYSNLTDKRERALFGLMCATGIRICEVSNALIEDIRKYNDEYVLFVLGKKRDSKSEYVKLSNEVLQDIQNYVGNRTNGYIFISESNNNYGNGMTTTALRNIIKNIFKRFGLKKDSISCHSLRRTFAVISYETGNSIYDIQQVLRHHSIATTTRYLKQVDRDKNKTEYSVANAIFG